MKVNQQLQTLNNRLDKARRKLSGAQERGDKAMELQFGRDIEACEKQIAGLKKKQSRELNGQSVDIKALPFHRELTKAEQADMGKLKKTVRGLVVVHPLTALGKQMGIAKVTGYAPKDF